MYQCTNNGSCHVLSVVVWFPPMVLMISMPPMNFMNTSLCSLTQNVHIQVWVSLCLNETSLVKGLMGDDMSGNVPTITSL